MIIIIILLFIHIILSETLCKAMIDNDVLNLLCNGFLAKQEDATVIQMGLRALSAILDSG